MDPESAKLYHDPQVVVVGYEEQEDKIQSACQIIFGRRLDCVELVDFIGAPSGSSVSFGIIDDHAELGLKIYYKWFEEPHEYLVYVEQETGKRIVYIENVHHRREAPMHLATRILGRQVRKFREYGISEIRLLADGHAYDPTFNGYYTWSRLGYVLYLNGYGARLMEAGFEPVGNTMELFAQPNGREWWRDNGSATEAYFYLAEDSPCVRRLEDYLTEKGIILDE